MGFQACTKMVCSHQPIQTQTRICPDIDKELVHNPFLADVGVNRSKRNGDAVQVIIVFSVHLYKITRCPIPKLVDTKKMNQKDHCAQSINQASKGSALALKTELELHWQYPSQLKRYLCLWQLQTSSTCILTPAK